MLRRPDLPATLILQEATVDEADGAEIDLGTVRVRRETIPGNEAKHELEFTIVELRDGLIPVGMRGTLLYPVALHSRTSADSVVRGLLAVLAAATGRRRPAGPPSGNCEHCCGEHLRRHRLLRGTARARRPLAALAAQDFTGEFEVIVSDNEGSAALREHIDGHRNREWLAAVGRLVGCGRNLPREGMSVPELLCTTLSSIAIRTTRSIRAGCRRCPVPPPMPISSADHWSGTVSTIRSSHRGGRWVIRVNPRSSVGSCHHLRLQPGCAAVGVRRRRGWTRPIRRPAATSSSAGAYRHPDTDSAGHPRRWSPTGTAECARVVESGGRVRTRGAGRQTIRCAGQTVVVDVDPCRVVLVLLPVWPWAWSRRRRGEWVWITGNLVGRLWEASNTVSSTCDDSTRLL